MVLGKMAIEQVCSSGHNFKLAIPLSQGILVWINYDDHYYGCYYNKFKWASEIVPRRVTNKNS